MSHSWCLPEVFTIRLIMESDWHVGSGTGRPGNIDRLVTRDADGLPYVPAKTLHGIWRDACERLCQVLDRPQPSGWINWVNYLFGSQPALGKGDPTGRHKDPTKSPVPAALQVRAAYIPDSLRRLLAGENRRRLQSVLTIIKPGVKIDRRSGTAQTDFLRFEEMGRKGTILEATCRLDGQFSPELREAASAILIASTKLMEWLGGKRRRGAGKCRVEIVGADLDAAIKWLKENAQPPTPTIESRRQDSDLALGTVQGTANDKWLVVPLRLHLQSPVAVSVRFTGNVVESLDYIPGTYLLPHITAVFPELRPGVLAGEVIVTPAYPEVDGEASLPVPFCLHVHKDKESEEDIVAPEKRSSVVNRLVETLTRDTQLKPLRSGYINEKPNRLHKVKLVYHTHNTVDDSLQRPTSDLGGVYTYGAIAHKDKHGPVVFQCELRVNGELAKKLDQNTEEPSKWYKKLDGTIAIGRSKKDDYGEVRIEALAPVYVDLGTTTKSDVANTTGASASADSTPSQGVSEDKNKSTNKQLYVWLVSDTIIRDEKLRPAPTAEGLRAELSKRLGVDLKVRGSTEEPSEEGKCVNCKGEGDRLDCIVRTRRLETWQVQWERPRPSLVALAAGSCLVVTYEGQEIDPQILRRVEMEGIGERRAEGFGQVRFNHPLVCKRPAEWAEVVSAKKSAEQSSAGSETDREGAGNVPPARLDGDLAVFARMLECEYIKKEIRRASVRIASQRDRRKELLGWQLAGPQGAPPMSQLGGLRSQLIQVRGWDDGKRVLDWLEHLEQNPRRKEKWPEQSIDKVRSLFRERSKIWEVLEIPYWPDLTPNARTQLQSELWAFAIRSLLDACIRAHKRDLEGVPS